MSTQQNAYAKGTVKNLLCQWKKFVSFTHNLSCSSFPVSVDILCLYIQFLSRSLSSPQSVRNYVSGLKTVHSLCGVAFPSSNDILVRLTLRGLDRSLCHVPRRALPITPQILRKIYRVLDVSVPEQAVLWCLYLFLFYLFARKSQFMATSAKDPLMNKLVARRDVRIKDRVLQVQFKWTKTHQTGGEILVIPLSPVPGSVLCPVRAFQRMITLVPAPPSSPVFVIPSGSTLKPVFYSKFQELFRRNLAEVGLDPSGFSSHSFRRGGASFAFACGVPGELVQLYGDWRSDAYKVYVDFSFEHKLFVSNRISSALL